VAVRICKYLCVSVRISEWVWSVSKYYLRGQRFRDRSARFRKFIFLVKRGHNLWGRYNRRGVVVIFVTLVRLTVWSGYTSVTIRGFDEFACLDDRRRQEKQFYVHFLRTSCPDMYTICSHQYLFRFTRSCCPQRVRCPTFRASSLRFRPKTDDVLALHPSVTFSVQYKISLFNSLLK